MGSASGLHLRLAAWMGRRGQLASAFALALAAVAVAWVGIAEVEAGHLLPEPRSEMLEREALKQSVHALFDRNDFAALERLAGDFRNSGARTPSGIWKLTVFYTAFHDISASIGATDDRGWQRFSAKLADWQGQFAEKPTALVVQGIALKSFAWSLRPRWIVLEASTGAATKFQAALNNARDMLDHAKSTASADPHYYVLRADLATALGEAPDQVMALTDEGRAKFPDYFALDFSGLDYFGAGDGAAAPGPIEAMRVEAFASTAASKTGADGGAARYARLYWHAYQAFYGNDLFRKSRVDWPRMRTGLGDIALRYPDAWNVNNFAYFACLAGDRGTARRLIASIAGRPPLEVWQSRAIFAGCRRWASLEPQSRR